MTSRTTPPTTPPAIAPTFIEEASGLLILEVALAAVDVAVEVREESIEVELADVEVKALLDAVIVVEDEEVCAVVVASTT